MGKYPVYMSLIIPLNVGIIPAVYVLISGSFQSFPQAIALRGDLNNIGMRKGPRDAPRCHSLENS